MLTSQLAGAARHPADPMRILEVSVYRGPHLYSQSPMIRIQVDLGALEVRPSDTLPGFGERLLALLPGLVDHGCSYGERGGFLRRLDEGTWMGHVIEHLALELQHLVGHDVARGKTRSVRGRSGVYDIMFAYEEEAIGRAAGRLALELLQDVLPEQLRGIEGLEVIGKGLGQSGLDDGLTRLKALAVEHGLGPTTSAIVREARRRGIPTSRLNDSSLVLLGQGKHQKRICASCSDMTSEVATEIAADKSLTKRLLEDAGLPVPQGVMVASEKEACAAAERFGYPLVTKPLDGNHGRGVNVGLSDADEVRWGFAQAHAHSEVVIVEQFFTGSDHRILVIGGEIAAVAERVPAHVVGDGRHTIVELVDEANKDPRRGDGHCKVLSRIEVDACVEHFLARAGLTPLSVPAKGQKVFLRPTANLSTGGTAIDRTDDIHPENALIAKRAAKIIGLDIAGIDFVCPDISKPVSQTGGGIIEVNAGPGFRMHLEPSEGRPRNVARPVLDLLYPDRANGRIPIFAITGTNGKSTTARMLTHILQRTGLSVGLTSTTGVYIDGQRVMSGDCSGPKSARLVLREPSVEAAVLECARGGILREGLAFDSCDVGAVLNVAPDHLGLKGIETLEDLAAVKAVVVQSVRRNGWSVLNADDPMTCGMAEDAGGRICFFSLRDRSAWSDGLRDHVERGGRAVTRERTAAGWDIVIHEDEESHYLMDVAEVPATFDGMAEFNVANTLAAVAVAHCHGVPMKTIRAALTTFSTSFELSPGRLNVFDGHGFRTVLDYAHNPHGLQELGKFIAKMRHRYNRTIGMIGIAGDRRDSDILEMGALATGMFDIIVIKEDEDLRGRASGEVAALLREGALAAGCSSARLHTVLDEEQAVGLCLRLARDDDLVVLTAEEIEAVWKHVAEFDRSAPTIGVLGENVRHLQVG